MKEIETSEVSFFKTISKGVGIATITSILFILILAAVLTYTNTSENITNIAIIVIASLSVFIGGKISSSKLKQRRNDKRLRCRRSIHITTLPNF
jgi:hypothetical protein